MQHLKVSFYIFHNFLYECLFFVKCTYEHMCRMHRTVFAHDSKIIRDVLSGGADVAIADFGCGEGELSQRYGTVG